MQLIMNTDGPFLVRETPRQYGTHTKLVCIGLTCVRPELTVEVPKQGHYFAAYIGVRVLRFRQATRLSAKHRGPGRPNQFPSFSPQYYAWLTFPKFPSPSTVSSLSLSLPNCQGLPAKSSDISAWSIWKINIFEIHISLNFAFQKILTWLALPTVLSTSRSSPKWCCCCCCCC